MRHEIGLVLFAAIINVSQWDSGYIVVSKKAHRPNDQTSILKTPRRTSSKETQRPKSCLWNSVNSVRDRGRWALSFLHIMPRYSPVYIGPLRLGKVPPWCPQLSPRSLWARRKRGRRKSLRFHLRRLALRLCLCKTTSVFCREIERGIKTPTYSGVQPGLESHHGSAATL